MMKSHWRWRGRPANLRGANRHRRVNLLGLAFFLTESVEREPLMIRVRRVAPQRVANGSAAFVPAHCRTQSLQHLDLPGVICVVKGDAGDQLALRPALALCQRDSVPRHGNTANHRQQSLMFVGQQADVGRPGGVIGAFRNVWPIGRAARKTRRCSTLEAPSHRVLPVRDVQCQLPDAFPS